jgi:hypothetical protein
VSQTSADFLRRMWRQASGEGCLWLRVVRLGLALGKRESQRFKKHTAVVIICPVTHVDHRTDSPTPRFANCTFITLVSKGFRHRLFIANDPESVGFGRLRPESLVKQFHWYSMLFGNSTSNYVVPVVNP